MNKFYLLLPALMIGTVIFNVSGRTCTNNSDFSETLSVSGSSTFFLPNIAVSISSTEAYNLKDILKAKSDNHLDKLVTEVNPCVYFLTDQTMVVQGDTPIKLEMYVNSIPQLYDNNKEYETVELIKIQIRSKEEQYAPLDLNKLTGFKNLKYILFEYEYSACGSIEDDMCLKEKTISKVMNQNQNIQVLYLLSIPQ